MRTFSVLLLLTALLLVSCSAEPVFRPDTTDTAVPDTTVPVPVTEETTPTETTPPETVPPETTAEPLPVLTAVTLPFSAVEFRVGESITPAVSLAPADVTAPLLWQSSDPAVAAVAEDGAITALSRGECTVTVTADGLTASISVSVVEDIDPFRIDGVLLVNKSYPLPEGYAPGQDEEAFSQLCVLFSDAKAAGYALKVASGYRSFADQRYIYNGYVAGSGQEAADRFSARPGHSEHQSGLAFDVNHPDSNQLLTSFGDSPVGQWIAENAHRYGFIIRYPADKESVTGYMYEPWHLRYVGTDLAAALRESGLCLEEYFGIPSAYRE